MDYQYRILSEQTAYHGFFRVTRYQVDIDYYDGSRSGALVRECLGKGGLVVAALPYDPVREEFVFVEQFRIGAMVAEDNPWQQEIVAGFVDVGEELPEVAIQRELKEEIGAKAIALEKVYEYYGSPGGSAGRTVLYFAQVDAEEVAQFTGVRAEGEDIRVLRIPYSTVFMALKNGEVDNATMLIALQHFVLKNPEIQKKYEI